MGINPTTKRLLLGVRPAWLQDLAAKAGALPAFAADFTLGQAFLGTQSFPVEGLISCARSSSGYYQNASGALTNFPSGTLRRGSSGLLVEEARTNLCIRSQEFDNAAWIKTNITATADTTTAPDGTLTADSVLSSSNSTAAKSIATAAINWTSGTSYTMLVYVKPIAQIYIQITMFSAAFGVNAYCNFDLQNGALGTQGSAVTASGIQALADGWFRIYMAAPATGTVSVNAQFGFVDSSSAARAATSAAASGTGLYLWGAQVEAGSFPTSYIPTTAASVTRSADIDILGIGTIDSIKGASGTIYSELGNINLSAQTSVIIGRSSVDQRFQYLSGTGALNAFNGTNILATANTYSGSGGAKCANAFDPSGRANCLNGGTVATDANGVGTIIDNCGLGSNSGGHSLNGYLTRLVLWNSRLSNVKLQAIAT